MLDWILVGLIIAIAALLLGRSIYKAITAAKPTCACGHVDCPLASECSHYPADSPQQRPADCPLATGEDGQIHQPTGSH